eukprot:CAMPEP_0172675828 /NCGR_PEP_ID=MMETSP1074-20121228/13523_1 /TAXON_ID=2916 /ORGANISM="Ceratium fusus, Strain PA161109" /LENGTH=72 /DNA_ID=CAMNT_0013493337 /DNA_START=107 /DNA_END=325 /DNA_ORIENTATION=-
MKKITQKCGGDADDGRSNGQRPACCLSGSSGCRSTPNLTSTPPPAQHLAKSMADDGSNASMSTAATDKPGGR